MSARRGVGRAGTQSDRGLDIPSEHQTTVRLGVNIDHVATIRNARGASYPEPVRAAELALAAGADGITAHLREDRRHISDADIAVLTDLCRKRGKPLNFEMAVTDEMVGIALKARPHAACLVPERREEVTTEGGLDVVRGANRASPRPPPACAPSGRGCRCSSRPIPPRSRPRPSPAPRWSSCTPAPIATPLARATPIAPPPSSSA
jgi:hypothetical protein